jgi:regulator of cell morphogenesis and NO signaling
MSIDTASTVAELVVEEPARARVFEQFEIDYCCGGKRSLADACESRELDVDTVVDALDTTGGGDDPENVDWSAAPVGELCDHIVEVHHDGLRRELPRLADLLAKCERAHAAERPELASLNSTFQELRIELEHHMLHEERELFPACRSGEPLDETLVGHLEDEHASAGAALVAMRELSGGFDAGSALCNTHRVALDGLRELELDLHRHIHEENNILFPRVLAGAA